MSLPEDLTAGVTTGHVSHHEALHAAYNDLETAGLLDATKLAALATFLTAITSGGESVAYESYVDDAVTTHAALTSDVHGAVDASGEAVAKLVGGGERIFADLDAVSAPTGTARNDVYIAAS